MTSLLTVYYDMYHHYSFCSLMFKMVAQWSVLDKLNKSHVYIEVLTASKCLLMFLALCNSCDCVQHDDGVVPVVRTQPEEASAGHSCLPLQGPAPQDADKLPHIRCHDHFHCHLHGQGEFIATFRVKVSSLPPSGSRCVHCQDEHTLTFMVKVSSSWSRWVHCHLHGQGEFIATFMVKVS